MRDRCDGLWWVLVGSVASLSASALVACADEPGGGAAFDAGRDAPLDVRSDSEAQDVSLDDLGGTDVHEVGDSPDGGQPDVVGCPLGNPCNPIPILVTPYRDARDTRDADSLELDGYSCAPETDESGGEFVYELVVSEPSSLRASVSDTPGDGVDVDVHVLTRPSAAACLARDDTEVRMQVDAGTVFIVVDSWVGGDGQSFAGPYVLSVELTPSSGACATDPVDLPMFWSSCADGIDCYETEDPVDGQVRPHLRTPAVGPVVKEAHLVTVDDDGFDGTWPASAREGLDRHYAISELATGTTMSRTEAWAPAGEGGSEYGQGSTGQPLPVVDEAWYINMYWRHRPAPGTRMLVVNPENGLAVVAAAGYETGPGSNTAIAGVAEEVHGALGTTHRATLEVGFLLDQSLPLGPIDCQ